MLDKMDLEEQLDANQPGAADGSNIEEAYSDSVPTMAPRANDDTLGSNNGVVSGGGHTESHTLDPSGLASGLTDKLDAQQQEALNKVSDVVAKNGGVMLIVMVASLVVLIEASVKCGQFNFCENAFGFAVAGGLISLLVTGAFLFLERGEHLEAKPRLFMTIFLFIWWVAIAGVTTFVDPFRTPGNGYFAAWAGFFGTLHMMMHSISKVRETVDKLASLGFKFGLLLVGSAIVMFSGFACLDNCSGSPGFALVVGLVSLALALVMTFAHAKISDGAIKWMSIFLVLWWLVAFFVLTFFGPFESVGNGYFATIGCLAAALMIASGSQGASS